MNTGLLSSALLKLQRRIMGKVIVPTDAAYHEYIALFNRAVARKPSVIVFVVDINDIGHALKYAKQFNMPVGIRGGGHSVYGSCLVENGLVLDMRGLKEIHVDVDKQTVRVDAGCLLSEVDIVTRQHNLALPQGTCPSVGVVGSSLGGGVGFLSRKYGLISDCIKKIRMVKADGVFINVDADQHKELFWAMRGAGAANFGVVTDIEYALFPVPEKVYGGTLSWPISSAKTILQKYRELHRASSDDVFMYAFFPYAVKANQTISLFGFSMESAEKSEALFAEMRSWAKVSQEDVEWRPYYEMQAAHYESSFAIAWKHGFVEGDMSDEFIDACIASMETCPDNGGGIMFDPLGGAINRISADATAFRHRNAQFICSINGLDQSESVSPAVQSWVDASYAKLMPFFNGQAYQNYEDKSLDEAQCYFGEHLFRLRTLKKQYDPEGRFQGKVTV